MQNQHLANGEFFFPKAGLTAKRNLHDPKCPPGSSQSASGRDRSILSATDLGGRLPRLRDVSDDGGGAASGSRGPGAAGERILEIPRLSSEPCGVDWLFVARFDSTVVFVSRRRGAAVFHRQPKRPRAIRDPDDVARGLAGAGPGVAGSFSAFPVPSLGRRGTL